MNITILLCSIMKSPERFSTYDDTTKYDSHFIFFAVNVLCMSEKLAIYKIMVRICNAFCKRVSST